MEAMSLGNIELIRETLEHFVLLLGREELSLQEPEFLNLCKISGIHITYFHILISEVEIEVPEEA